MDRVVLEAEKVSMIPSFYFYTVSRQNSLTTKLDKRKYFGDLLAITSWECYFEEEHIDEEIRNAFRKMIARLYCYEILGNTYLFHQDEKKEYLLLAKPLLFYLGYSTKIGIRMIRILSKCLGIKFTCHILGVLKSCNIIK